MANKMSNFGAKALGIGGLAGMGAIATMPVGSVSSITGPMAYVMWTILVIVAAKIIFSKKNKA